MEIFYEGLSILLTKEGETTFINSELSFDDDELLSPKKIYFMNKKNKEIQKFVNELLDYTHDLSSLLRFLKKKKKIFFYKFHQYNGFSLYSKLFFYFYLYSEKI